MKTYICFIIILSGILSLPADTIIEGGEVSGVWSIDSAPYIINGDIFITQDNSLTILPGVDLIFNANYSLSVSGQLMSVGTVNDSILWTIADTTGFSNTEISDGGWGGIIFDYLCSQNDNSILSYNRFEFGKKVGESEQEITGGAICVDNCSNLNISYNNFSNCLAVWGGAIGCINSANPTIEFNIIQNNETYSCANHNGCSGAVFCNSSACPVISNNIIRNNYSQDNGGAISSFSSSAPQITDNIFSNNSSHDGGAIVIGTAGSASVTGNVFSENYASFTGGGISFSGAENCMISNNLFTANHSEYYGGGIAFFKSYSINISNNIIEYNSSNLGGGISDTEEFNSDITISGNSIRYNSATLHGGGISWNCNGLTIDNSNMNSIYSNSAGIADDAYLSLDQLDVYIDTFTVMIPTNVHAQPIGQYNFVIQNSIFEQVQADIYVSPDGSNSNNGLSPDTPLKTIDHAVRIILPSDNLLSIYLAEGTYSHSTNGEIFPVTGLNNVHFNGAGINETILDAELNNVHFYYDNIESAEISNLQITHGFSTLLNFWAAYNGAVNVINSSIYLHNIDICNSNGLYFGGGLTLKNSSCIIHDSKLRDNSVHYYGGAISCENSTIFADKCQINSNFTTYQSQTNGGAFSLIDSSMAVITNSTIVDNFADCGGAVFCDDNSSMYLINSICRDNSDNEIYTEQSEDFDNPPVFAYSNIAGGSEAIVAPQYGTWVWYDGNIDEDPLFSDPVNGDYSLTENSPCIDAGTNWFDWFSQVIIDLDDDEYYGSAPDIGCYEYQPSNNSNNQILPHIPLLYNYPNPFNPVTYISFSAPDNAHVKIDIFNLKGQHITNLYNDIYQPDNNNFQLIQWNGIDNQGNFTGSGIYLIRLNINNSKIYSKKCLLLK